MIDEILNSYSLSVDYIEQLLSDVADELITSQPAKAANHPAWTIGHLILSAQMIGGEIGIPKWLPDDWSIKYGTGSIPIVDRTSYPAKQDLLRMMRDAQRRLTDRLLEIGDLGLAAPFPDERYRELFPTTGHAILQVVAAHTAMHVGQLIVWRRLMGIAPLRRPYD